VPSGEAMRLLTGKGMILASMSFALILSLLV
jgi:hypothetical protein